MNFRSLLTIICVTALLSCKQKAPTDYVIKVGAAPTVSTAGIFIAQEKGYFKELGLNVQIEIFRSSGAEMTVLLSKGNLDVGAGNISAGLWNAINQGSQIKLVADKGHIEKDHNYISLIVRDDHLKSGRYKTYKDLKGFKMALTALEGVSQEIAAEKFLQQGGLSLTDVEFIKMSYSEMNVALASKNIDATVQLEPYVTQASLEGIAQPVGRLFDVYPDQQSAAIIYSPPFISQHRSLAEKFMVAYLKGIRDYENAFIKNVGKAEIIEMLKKYINVESADVWNSMELVGLNPNGFLNTQSLANDINWYYEHKYIDRVPDIQQVVDHSFVKKAVRTIGQF